MKNTQVQRLPALDYLRFFAAMLVVAYHYLYRGSVQGGYLNVSFPEIANGFSLAYYGVNLFFIISGFVILWSAENKNWFEFSLARFTRLWPAYVLATTITAIAILIYNQPLFDVSLAKWLANLTFFAPAFGHAFMDGVYWTIVLELIFYFWIALAIMTGVVGRYPLLGAIWLAVIVVNEFWLQSGALQLVAITRYGPWFLVGMMVYHFWKHKTDLLSATVFAAAVALTFFAAATEQAEVAKALGTSSKVNGALMMNAVTLLVFFACVKFGHLMRSTNLAIAIGGLTYPLYLVHQNLGYMLINSFHQTLGKWLAAAVTAIAMIAISWAIMRFWERPVAKWLKVTVLEFHQRLFPGKGPAT